MVEDLKVPERRMGDEGGITTAARRRGIAISAAVLLAMACGMAASPASAQSLTDRFKSLFGGGKSEEPAAPTVSNEPEDDLTCPPVSIRAGASTYAVAAPGKQAIGNDLRFQATITRTARPRRAGSRSSSCLAPAISQLSPSHTRTVNAGGAGRLPSRASFTTSKWW